MNSEALDAVLFLNPLGETGPSVCSSGVLSFFYLVEEILANQNFSVFCSACTLQA